MLDPVCTETMLIKTFGSEDCSTQQCEQIELEISPQLGDSLKMSFLSILLICEFISGQSISYAVSTYKKLASWEFSDYVQSDSSLQVDILVRLDQYWRLVTGFAVIMDQLLSVPDWVGCCLDQFKGHHQQELTLSSPIH